MKKDYSDNDEFDARLRRLLRDLPVPAEFAVAPPRRRFLRVGLAWAAGLAGVGIAGGWAMWRELSMPSLVRVAFAHAREEAEVRGIHVRDAAAAQAAFGIASQQAFPGALQLCKDCLLGDQSAWHVNLYLDDHGFVHLFALRDAPAVSVTEGRALEGYWRFFTSRSGFSVLALAENSQALSVITRTLFA